jgi:hypothetical protein
LRAAGTSFAVVFADLDHFNVERLAVTKPVTGRHIRGDAAVELRDDDLACRYGGENSSCCCPVPDGRPSRRCNVRPVAASGVPVACPRSPQTSASRTQRRRSLDDLVQRADGALFAPGRRSDSICIDGHRGAVASNLLPSTEYPNRDGRPPSSV